MRFIAAGDYVAQQRLPRGYEGFEEVAQWIQSGDARYFNLETTLHREGECYGFALNGGSYLRAEPEVLEDCKEYGFNMVSFCNNHAMDFGYEGMLKTLDHVKESGMVHTGVGRNLDQAAAPAYLNTAKGRVALIAFTATCNSVCDEVGMAGRQSRRVMGRPGVNLLRVKETLYITREQMDVLKDIAHKTQVNAREEIARAEGYRAPLADDVFNLAGKLNFQVAQENRRELRCHQADLARAERALYEAQLQADHVIVSIHSHQISGNSKENPPEFLEEFAHFCIEHGAEAVIGHGPHLLRPIEIYKGKPIFYSLGDFVLENESTDFCPEEYYEAQGLTSDASMHELYRKRSKDFTRGLLSDYRMTEAVIPRWEVVEGKMTKLELLPIELGRAFPRSQAGLPKRAAGDAILQRLAEMSKPYGTKIEVKDGIGNIVEW